MSQVAPRHALSMLGLSLLCTLGIPERSNATVAPLSLSWRVSSQRRPAGGFRVVIRALIRNRSTQRQVVQVCQPSVSVRAERGAHERTFEVDSSHVLGNTGPARLPGLMPPACSGSGGGLAALSIAPKRSITFGLFRFNLDPPFAKGSRLHLRLQSHRSAGWSGMPVPPPFGGVVHDTWL